MVCQKCQSIEATVHTTTIVNGSSTESHLCIKCSGVSSQGLATMPTDIQGLLQQMFGGGPLALLPNSPLLNLPLGVPAQPAGENLDKACPHCGITLGDIRRTGKLGCPHDYSVFGETLSQVIAVSQAGAQRHIGKVPRNAPADVRRAIIQARVDDLQRKLESAVFREDYESAAKHRDDIKDARSELD